MIQRVRIAPEYSILFVAGPEDNVLVPLCDKQDITIWSTETCIVFGCFAEIDGDTEVTLAPAAELQAGSVQRPDCVLRFDGELETPERELEVTTAADEVVMDTSVQSALTRVRIWSDHPKEPEHVFIGWG
ncbi:MAG: hypothetical protein QNJ62_12935 [Methyloceanibacter sp.]|nr:hypothetical protein [Methyloceanibacter sp.]